MCKLGGYQCVCPVPSRVPGGDQGRREKNTDFFLMFHIVTIVLPFLVCLYIRMLVSGYGIFLRVAVFVDDMFL
nr:MAG: hypothetical protein [Crogonang virus 171]